MTRVQRGISDDNLDLRQVAQLHQRLLPELAGIDQQHGLLPLPHHALLGLYEQDGARVGLNGGHTWRSHRRIPLFSVRYPRTRGGAPSRPVLRLPGYPRAQRRLEDRCAGN